MTQTLNRRAVAFQRARPVAAGTAVQERLTQRRSAKLGTQIGFMDWALKVPEPKSGRLDFHAFPFQRELYLEGVHEKEAVVQKATQIGMSAFSVRWALYHADTRGRTGLYVFPTQKDMHDFSSLRIKPMIDGSQYLLRRKRPDDPDNKGMKGVGLGMVVFRGSESKRGLDSVDCDHIVFDEYDTLDWDNIPDAEMRVSSPLSPGLIRRIGVPSVPERGVSKLFNDSDQRHWHVKCPACNLRQPLDFFENVDKDAAIRVCSECHASLEDAIAHGEWVAKFPDQGRSRGYHVSRLIVPGANIAALVAASKKRNPTEKTVFFNKHLGLPYVAAENRLSREAIAAAQTRGGNYSMAEAYVGDKLITMGVDVATTRPLSVRISEHLDEDTKRALWIGQCDRFFEYETAEGPSLEGLMRRFGVHMCAIDHLPDGRMARAFAEKFRGMVYLVHYDGKPSPKDSRVFKVDDEMLEVTVRRTAAIDAALEMVRAQRNLLPVNLPDQYVEEMGALVRERAEDDVGKTTIVYRKYGDDDYAHAEVYDLVATELWLHRQLMGTLTDESLETIDEHLELERSELATYASPDEYYAGGREE